MTVMTFNIRYGSANDGPDAWPNRRQLTLATIRAHDPDLLGAQEVLDFQADELRKEFPSYGFVGVGRDDGQRRGEFSPILFRKARFELLESGTLWLSEKPEEPGSIGWDAALPRVATWVKVRDRHNAGETLVFVNTHWDHQGVAARVESARLVRRMLQRIGEGLPVIVVGDLNVDESTDAYATLLHGDKDGLRLLDAYRAVHPNATTQEATFHAFRGTFEGSRIDFVLHNDQFRALSASIDRRSQDQRFPSDHYPVVAVLGRGEAKRSAR